MELKTRQTLANKAAKKWKEQYCDQEGRWHPKWARLDNPFQSKYAALLELGGTPKPEDVNTIIGNDSWTSLKCDECEAETDTVVIVGQPPDYESSTASICVGCINAAYHLTQEFHP